MIGHSAGSLPAKGQMAILPKKITLKKNDMKKQISISDFSFQFSGYGYYKVTYTSPVTGKKWQKTTSNMPLIDATKNSDYPKKSDLIALKYLCKN